MQTAKLTIRLPQDSIAFAKQYARAHRITLTELIARHLRRLQSEEGGEIHPMVQKLSGLIPPEVDAEAEYHEYLLKKHR